jgi:hypothetical protein
MNSKVENDIFGSIPLLKRASDYNDHEQNHLSSAPLKPEVKLSNPKDSIGVRKAPMSTIPANVLAEMGVAMLEGTAKYGRHNYREVGVRASVYYDAVMRHLFAWWEGEDIDPDSGVSHITKAMTALVVLRDSMMQENWADDRPPKSKNFYTELNEKSGSILDKHADKSPKHITELNKYVQVTELNKAV